MKTFKDLKFNTHPNYGTGGFQGQAVISFENGYEVSVITGGYGTDSSPYELAILKNGDLCYDTPITDDVIGYLTKQDVTDYMIRVQKL